MKSDITELTQDEIGDFTDLAGRFSRGKMLQMFENDLPDGDLQMLPELLHTAFVTGIAASPNSSQAGYEFGVWGRGTDSSGFAPSLLLLSVISEVCAGVSMCIHAQGVAVNLLLQGKGEPSLKPERVALCIQEEFGLPFYGTILSPASDSPARVATTAVRAGDRYVINGVKTFVYGMPDAEAYLVFARLDDRWGCFLVPVDAEGLMWEDPGQRTGLRACELCHLTLHDVRVPEKDRIDGGDARDLVLRSMTLNWLGMSAIAVGIARGAVAAAKRYASERYQGGMIIEHHPAMKMLIAGSEARTRTAAATVVSHRSFGGDIVGALRAAAMTKLSVMELCAQAVTDCLQTFGGYGYMDDFGMSKRLRDVTTLKSGSGAPHYLKQLIFDIEKE